jgi:DNA-binding response OmpR family regulator
MHEQRKILVVEDDRITRDLLRTILEHADYEVIQAEDGVSAVAKAEAEKPDLVIIDGSLPRMHGLLACKAINQLDPSPKIIVLTEIYTKPTYKWEVIDEYDADDLLTKPTKPADLLACVQKHLAGATPRDPSELLLVQPKQSAL